MPPYGLDFFEPAEAVSHAKTRAARSNVPRRLSGFPGYTHVLWGRSPTGGPVPPPPGRPLSEVAQTRE